MNVARQSGHQQKPQQEMWPQKLNKALIAVGVIAFGLIITDRVIEMFSADETPAVQAEVERTQKTEIVSVAAAPLSESGSEAELVKLAAAEPLVAAASSQSTEAPVLTDAANESAVDLQKIFGSRVVFVSASEPVYVVTEDDRRFDVGSEIDSQTTLAGVTAQQLILEHSGDLTVISLPDPVVQ